MVVQETDRELQAGADLQAMAVTGIGELEGLHLRMAVWVEIQPPRLREVLVVGEEPTEILAEELVVEATPVVPEATNLRIMAPAEGVVHIIQEPISQMF